MSTDRQDIDDLGKVSLVRKSFRGKEQSPNEIGLALFDHKVHKVELSRLKPWIKDLDKAQLASALATVVNKASCIVSNCVSSGADIIPKNFHLKVVFLDETGTARVAESCNTVISALERNKLGIVCLVGDVQQFSAQDDAWEVHWSDSTGTIDQARRKLACRYGISSKALGRKTLNDGFPADFIGKKRQENRV